MAKRNAIEKALHRLEKMKNPYKYLLVTRKYDNLRPSNGRSQRTRNCPVACYLHDETGEDVVVLPNKILTSKPLTSKPYEKVAVPSKTIKELIYRFDDERSNAEI